MRFFALEKLINLHDGYRKVFNIDQLHLLLIQIDGELHLIESQCPHRGHPLSEANLGEDFLRCPLHGYRFALPSGKLIYSTEEPCRGLRTYQLAYQEKDVGIWLDKES
jgi:nitrite reductase/ring-hydroxylating ferredoxin subunit